MVYSAYSVYIDFPPYLSFMYLRSTRERRAGMNRSSAEKLSAKRPYTESALPLFSKFSFDLFHDLAASW